MTIRYSVVGLGKLGASMAAAIASRGFDVVGVDVNPRAVEAVNAGHAPVQETGLDDLVRTNRARLRAVTSHSEAILASDVTFVVVPTPSDDRGAFSLQYAAWAFREIGKALASKDGYHLVVLTSTVLPGATRHGLLPILEDESGKKCGPDFGLCYSPEFIALGSVIYDFLHPDFTLVGEFDVRSGSMLEKAYASIMLDNPLCRRMSLENGELTKIAVNTYITTKMTFANMLAEMCERIPGGDVDVVADALGSDKRIGRKYLTGAIGYGGPCFPRDNVALSFFARAMGGEARLVETTHSINCALAEKIVARLRPLVKGGTTVAVLGLAYKPSSHVVEESQGIYITKALSKAGARVVAYDPLAAEAARLELRDQAVVMETVKACLEQAKLVLLTTPDPLFKALKAEDFANGHPVVTVVDCWRILSHELAGRPGIRYVPIGCSVEDGENAATLAALWGGAAKGA